MPPHLAGIFIYPIKSLDGVRVSQATVLNSGALKHDRTYALADEQGQFINGKREARIHQLRSKFDAEMSQITLQIQNKPESITFHLQDDRSRLEVWFSDYFGRRIQLVQNTEMGFPDDTYSPGPTILSTASLESMASWFPEVDLAEMRRRFRANLELADVPPFWEDRLFAEEEEVVQFQIGDVQFAGVNPCQRCVVPTRDSLTGTATPRFQKTFVSQRQATLPQWVNRSRFNHFFRLSVNTRIPASEAGKQLRIGDEVYLNEIA